MAISLHVAGVEEEEDIETMTTARMKIASSTPLEESNIP
jgi:hypothetical protein